MPIFDYECENCKTVFEYLWIKSDDSPICSKCNSSNVHKIFTSKFHVRMDADVMKHELPDPSPPLRELVGKTRPGCKGGFKELENDHRELKEYNRTKDKQGNNIWLPKERSYIDMGKRKKDAR